MPEEKIDAEPQLASREAARRNRRSDREPVEDLFRPAFIICVGRGYTGKTTTSRWIWGRARRPVLVYDGDVSRMGLRRFVADAVVAASADDVDVREGLMGLINRHIDEKIDVLVDLGGGDRVFPDVVKELDLLDLLNQSGSCPVILHLAGPDPDDLALLAELEGEGMFAPECTGILFNEHLISKHSSNRVFQEAIAGQTVLQRAINRGARVARIPRLATADSIAEAGVGFQDAAAGCPMSDGLPLGPVQRQLTRQWLKGMDRAMADMLGWLP